MRNVLRDQTNNRTNHLITHILLLKQLFIIPPKICKTKEC